MDLRYHLTFIDEKPSTESPKRSSSEPPGQEREQPEEARHVESLWWRAAALGARSVGSFGHPELCCRPCVHLTRNGCPAAEECLYCHLPHDVSRVSLDKRSRNFLEGLRVGAVLAVVLPALRQRMDRLHPEAAARAKELLQALEPEAEVIPDGANRRLQYRLGTMTFAGLMGLLTRYTSDHLADQAREALHQMRALSALCRC
ncbi:unnamed protein product [Effrenium voratum]|uniref:C3H1-type domain-containing protein n=1 Tax=Effrenium voratum TaxID=2562239 RepID=A0AA36N4J5_9DINO|nr:unnamed protein product [Effrenium voratum]CAJ1429925.1 unnamed protein product [Effrenium voratum]